MKQDTSPEKQAPLRPKGRMSNFQIAMLISAICTVVLSVLAIPAGIVLAIIFAAQGKRQLMAGLLAGMGIGIVVLGISCFAITTFTN